MRGAVVMVGLVVALVGCSSDDDAATDDAATDEPAAAAETVSPTTVSAAVESTAAPSTPAPSAPTSVPTTSASTAPSTVGVSDPVTPTGFDLVQATVTTADGDVCDLCLWVAETARERSQGLMGVTDLGRGDGMAFVYPAPHTGSFWMKNTLLPLSIAFFDDDGDYLDAFDMEPCTADPCPVYPTAPDFLVAIEAAQGDLGDLGIAEGSRLDLTDLPCA